MLTVCPFPSGEARLSSTERCCESCSGFSNTEGYRDWDETSGRRQKANHESPVAASHLVGLTAHLTEHCYFYCWRSEGSLLSNTSQTADHHPSLPIKWYMGKMGCRHLLPKAAPVTIKKGFNLSICCQIYQVTGETIHFRYFCHTPMINPANYG